MDDLSDDAPHDVPRLARGQRRPEVEAELEHWYALDCEQRVRSLRAAVDGSQTFNFETYIHISRQAYAAGDRKLLRPCPRQPRRCCSITTNPIEALSKAEPRGRGCCARTVRNRCSRFFWRYSTRYRPAKRIFSRATSRPSPAEDRFRTIDIARHALKGLTNGLNPRTSSILLTTFPHVCRARRRGHSCTGRLTSCPRSTERSSSNSIFSR